MEGEWRLILIQERNPRTDGLPALVFSKVILASKNSDHTTSSGMLKKSILDVSHEIPMPRY